VLREAVARVLRVELQHQGVAVHLGHDRGRGDRAVARVAADEGRLRHRQVGDRAGVDQHVIGRDRERGDRAAHRLEPGAVDVPAVDLLGPDLRHRDGHGRGSDRGGEALALRGDEPLRVVEAGQPHARRQDHRAGDDGPGERPHADLVDSGHGARAVAEERAPQREERGDAAPLAPVLHEPPLDERGEHARARPAVGGQRAQQLAERARLRLAGVEAQPQEREGRRAVGSSARVAAAPDRRPAAAPRRRAPRRHESSPRAVAIPARRSRRRSRRASSGSR
jgi:hypothetical protein